MWTPNITETPLTTIVVNLSAMAVNSAPEGFIYKHSSIQVSLCSENKLCNDDCKKNLKAKKNYFINKTK